MAVLTHEQRAAKSRKPISGAGMVFGPGEARKLFDETARRYFGISGDEFIVRWSSGYYRDSNVRTRATRVAMLIPLMSPTSARKKSR